MTLNRCAVIALIALAAGGATIANSASGQQVNLNHAATASRSSGPALGATPVNFESCFDCGQSACECAGVVDCGDACGLMQGGFKHGSGEYFFGGEYLQVRAVPSEAVSYLERDLSNIASPVDTFNQFDFGYNSSYRLYGGYRLSNCGGEVRFTYAHLESDADALSPAVPTDSSMQYIAPLEVVATVPGQSVGGSSSVELDSYDLGFSKTIPLGSPHGCSDPCDPCGGWCPAWDVTWTGALRFASVDWDRNYFSQGGGVPVRTGTSSMNFDGGGARLGVLGRRYLGQSGAFSVFLKGDVSVLVGDYEHNTARADAATPGQVTRQSIGGTLVVPVTELEAGGTVFLTSSTSFSAGYLLAAWHDLGFRDEYDFGLQTAYDDGNILGFDGYFLRLQTCF